MKRYAETIGSIIFFIAFINFAIFWVVALWIGGDAISGKVENGHYYVSNHGKLTEVSHAVWTYSQAHTISVFFTHPIGILVGGGLLEYSRRKGATGAH
jgi:hypothetical protein